MSQILKGTISAADGLREVLEIVDSLKGYGSCVLQVTGRDSTGGIIGLKEGWVMTGAMLHSGETGRKALRHILQTRAGSFVVLCTGPDPLPELRQGLKVGLHDVIEYLPNNLTPSVAPSLYDPSEVFAGTISTIFASSESPVIPRSPVVEQPFHQPVPSGMVPPSLEAQSHSVGQMNQEHADTQSPLHAPPAPVLLPDNPPAWTQVQVSPSALMPAQDDGIEVPPNAVSTIVPPQQPDSVVAVPDCAPFDLPVIAAEAASMVADSAPADGLEMADEVRQQLAERKTTEPPKPQPSAYKLSPSVVFAYILCTIIFGTMFFSIRLCIKPGGFTSYTAAALRFTIGTLVMAVIWAILGGKVKRPTLKEVGWIITSGSVYGLGVGLLYVSEEHISGGITAVISGIAQLFGIALGVLTRTEKVSRTTVLGSLIALTGVAVVFHDRMQVSSKQAAAIGFLIISMFLFALSNVMNKRFSRQVAMVAFNTFNCLAEALLLWLAAFLKHQLAFPVPLPLTPVMALLYLSTFGTAIVFAAYFYLIKQIGVPATMTIWFVSPLIALVVDAVFEKHLGLTAETYLGIAIVLLGVGSTLMGKLYVDWKAKIAAQVS